MIIKRYVLGMYQTNCYLMADENSKQCAIIDAGDISPLLEKDIDEGKYDVKYFMFTHGHFDHIGGLEYYISKYNKAKILMHKNDVDAILAGYDVFSANIIDKEKTVNHISLYNDGDLFELGESNITIIHTPGHTKGGVCIYTEGILFSGDTLFEGSIGRTDFVDGDFDELKKSILELYKLPDDTIVYPGHGNVTYLGDEKIANPFVRL